MLAVGFTQAETENPAGLLGVKSESHDPVARYWLLEPLRLMSGLNSELPVFQAGWLAGVAWLRSCSVSPEAAPGESAVVLTLAGSESGWSLSR